MVCIHLGELEAEPLHRLTVMTRHDDPFDEIVRFVPASSSAWSMREQLFPARRGAERDVLA